MAEGVLSDIAAKVLASFGKSGLQKAASWWGARDDLKKLQDSISIIKARVRDAENRHQEEGSDSVKEWLGRLKQVLYRADDLYEEVLIVDRKRKQTQRSKLVMQAGCLFSRSGPLSFSMNIARKIKSIRQELDAIKLDMVGLNLTDRFVDEPPHLMSRRETASFVQLEGVIGRETEKDAIIEMLFDPKYEGKRVTIIPIVGFGGLGKTTLAQFVFNDERVKNHFDIIKWACVPEVDNQHEVIKKVFKSLTGQDYYSLTLDKIKEGIQESITSNKYLLVLDDVWDDCRERWLDLNSLLECGKLGSKVIVTTRSYVVAKVLGTTPEAYKLGLLTVDESLKLFRRLAFKSGQEESNPNLTQIAKEVVASCGNVPLAIRVLGSLLYSKDSEEEWCLFRDAQLSKAKLTESSNIMPVLKLSYDNLPARLKQCFAYCSLFPKDYKFSKVELVSLWMAQGYLEPPSNGSSLEEVGDECFLELLWRNFFQDAEEDEMLNDDIYCKMHELMHDLAQHVANDGSIVLYGSSIQCTKRVVHASVHLIENSTVEESWDTIQELPQSLHVATTMRSLLFIKEVRFFHYGSLKSSVLKNITSRFQSLRVLYLKKMGIQNVTKSIGSLRHLSYLNLSENFMECLPNSITRLENLQTLCLSKCEQLTELPRGFTRLVNLRYLGNLECTFPEMPLGFEKMTHLKRLDKFVVGKSSGIDTLPALNLRGALTIEFGRWRKEAMIEARRVNLKGNQKLTHLLLDLSFQQEEEAVSSRNVEELLDCVQLPPSLKFLSVCHYGGERFPLKMVDKLTKLVHVRIASCRNCLVLPGLSRLPRLKYLYLDKLDKLEYIENDDMWAGKSEPCYMFPALESLTMWDLPELKRWSRVQENDVEIAQLQKPFFPRLSKLDMLGCSKLKLMPLAPKLQSLEAYNIHGKLLNALLMPHDPKAPSPSPQPSSSSSSLSSLTVSTSSSLKWLDLCSIDELVSLSLTHFCDLESLRIRQCEELKDLIIEYPNSIRELYIASCSSLRNVFDALQHLYVLEKLQILECEDLDVWDYDEEERNNSNKSDKSIIRSPSLAWKGMKSLQFLELFNIWKLESLPLTWVTTLQRLNIKWLKNLTALPDSIGHLSQLHEITIIGCPNLALLPQSLRSLTSLRELVVHACPHLERRCKKLDGEDWPLIQHIPHVTLG